MLFVMNNMCMGGIQKALISLLNELCTEFDITLLLFWKCGPLVDEIPSSVEVVETKSMFRLIGMSQHGCTTFLEKTTRGALVILTRLLGRRAAIELMKPSIRKDKLGDFDMVVSYSHCQASKMFYAGTAEYALKMRIKGFVIYTAIMKTLVQKAEKIIVFIENLTILYVCHSLSGKAF